MMNNNKRYSVYYVFEGGVAYEWVASFANRRVAEDFAESYSRNFAENENYEIVEEEI